MKNYVMCGIPRSGSTLVWQIMKTVFAPERVIKTHPDAWMPDGTNVVISIRDPRDVAASLLRVKLSRDEKEKHDENDVFAILKRVGIYYTGLRSVLIGPNVLLKYEDFYQDYDIIYDALEEGFDIEIPEDFRKEMTTKFNMQKNKERADKLKSFSEIGEWEIHGDHIGHIHPGYWNEYITGWLGCIVEDYCKRFCKEFGYE